MEILNFSLNSNFLCLSVFSSPTTCDAPDILPDVPDVIPTTELEPPSEPVDDNEDDDEFSYHDTQEDATDSSEHSPLKSYNSPLNSYSSPLRTYSSPFRPYKSPERPFGGTRSCPGTPDTHHPNENVFSGHFRERKGSLGNVCRNTLPTIGSVLRMDYR